MVSSVVSSVIFMNIVRALKAPRSQDSTITSPHGHKPHVTALHEVSTWPALPWFALPSHSTGRHKRLRIGFGDQHSSNRCSDSAWITGGYSGAFQISILRNATSTTKTIKAVIKSHGHKGTGWRAVRSSGSPTAAAFTS